MSEVENDTEALDGEQGQQHISAEQREQQMAEVPAAVTPMEMVGRALQQGITGETLQQFMDLQERYEANEARKAYAADMVKCQAKMPQIMAQVEGEKTGSLYAKLGQINQLITPIYTKHGFSISFGEGVAAIEGEIRTTCRVLHKLGHFEDFFKDLPPDAAGAQGTVNKTPIHARASSTSYGQRYIIKGIFNLSILSEDDDGTLAGAGSGSNRVSEEEAMRLGALVIDYELNAEAVLREFAILNWEQLPTKKYHKAMDRINVLGKARQR